MSKRLKAYAALLITAFIWGLAPPIIKYSLNFVTPVQFLFYRFLIVSIIVLPIFLIKLKTQLFKTKDWPRLLLVAVCGTTLTLGLLFHGLDKTTSVNAAVLAAITPIIIVLGGAIFLKETITNKEKVGLGLAFLGTLIAVVSPLLNTNGQFSGQYLAGNLLILVSNISWASYTILGKKLSKKYSSFMITSLAFFVGLLSFVPIFIYQQFTRIDQLQHLFYINPQGLAGILYMSLLGSIVAYFTYAYGMSKIEASEATLFTYLQPVFTLPLAVLWLGETISQGFIIGAIIIVLGVVLTEWKRKA